MGSKGNLNNMRESVVKEDETITQEQMQLFLKMAQKFNYVQQQPNSNEPNTPKVANKSVRSKLYKQDSLEQSATKRKIENQQLTRTKRLDKQDETRELDENTEDNQDESEDVELLEDTDNPEKQKEDGQEDEKTKKEKKDKKSDQLIVKPLYIVKFTCKDAKQFVAKYSEVNREIYRCKPNVFFERAYIDPNTLYLVIRTNTKRDEQMLKNPWKDDAFGGLKLVENEQQHIGAMKNVPRKINVDSEEFKNILASYGIKKAIRIKTKNDEVTPTVKIFVNKEDRLKQIVTNGILDKQNAMKFRVEYWNTKVIMCYKCQKQGHIAKNCTKEMRCARCGDDHDTKDCGKNKVYCTNCKSDTHSAWSTNCPTKIQTKIILNPYIKEIEDQKKAKKDEFNVWKTRQDAVMKSKQKDTKKEDKIEEKKEENNSNDELEARIKTILLKLLPQTNVNLSKNDEIETMKENIRQINEESNKRIQELSDKMDNMIQQHTIAIQNKDKEIAELKQKLEQANKAIKTAEQSKLKVQKQLDTQMTTVNQLEHRVTQLKQQQQQSKPANN